MPRRMLVPLGYKLVCRPPWSAGDRRNPCRRINYRALIGTSQLTDDFPDPRRYHLAFQSLVECPEFLSDRTARLRARSSFFVSGIFATCRLPALLFATLLLNKRQRTETFQIS